MLILSVMLAGAWTVLVHLLLPSAYTLLIFLILAAFIFAIFLFMTGSKMADQKIKAVYRETFGETDYEQW